MTSCLFSVTMLVTLAGATPSDVRWLDNYGVGLEVAKASGQPLLVILDNPAQPGQTMRQVSQRTDSTQRVLLGHYTLCHVDVSTRYGRRVARAFRATEFPYTTIIDKTSTAILYRKTGVLDDRQWITTLANYRTGTRPYHPAICFS